MHSLHSHTYTLAQPQLHIQPHDQTRPQSHSQSHPKFTKSHLHTYSHIPSASHVVTHLSHVVTYALKTPAKIPSHIPKSQSYHSHIHRHTLQRRRHRPYIPVISYVVTPPSPHQSHSWLQCHLTITTLPPLCPSSVTTHIPIVTPVHIVTLHNYYISKSCPQQQPYTITRLECHLTIVPLPPSCPCPSLVTHIHIVTPAHIVTLYPCYISKSCTQHQPYTIPQVIY